MTPCGNPLKRAGNRYRPEKGADCSSVMHIYLCDGASHGCGCDKTTTKKPETQTELKV